MRFLILACLLVLAWVPQAARAADASWWNQDFSFRKAITVDTTPTGANLTQAAGRVPLLVRLHSGNFQFDGVSQTGADIRFIASDDKTPLNYQIESFDPVLGVALVWVDIPDVGASTQQSIWMYYGNTKAPEASKGAAVFDADYSLVYHFDDIAGASPKDATAYANNAQSGSIRTVDGIIGKAGQFDGTGPLSLPASVSLNTTENGAFTFSTWIKVDTLPAGRALVYARRQNGKSLLIGLDQGVPFVEVDGEAPQRSEPGTAIKAGQWTHIAVTAAEGKFALYVDGHPYGTLTAALPAFTAAAVLGGDVPAEAGAAAPAGLVPFVGQLDEVRISRVARPATLIQLDAFAQGAESKLLQYAGDEKQAGMGFGYFGIIVKSVTADAWAVIGVLLVMALISWVVMWQRAVYVSTVTRANDEFLERFRGLGKNILGLGRDSLESAGLGGLKASSLFRLYEVGTKEVWSRRDEHGHTSIAAESIEAIRATMDSTLVRENQKLSKSMVLLTIAISGGPFLGLLGTVVGVMITFAAIAAAGDVNVNAIAPGIAAALLATVAGLFVAIPALFGYNYLLIRNKNVTANMQVFVDEFVTRLAELHRSADQLTLA
jgi:biopolymer transport protein ExbB